MPNWIELLKIDICYFDENTNDFGFGDVNYKL